MLIDITVWKIESKSADFCLSGWEGGGHLKENQLLASKGSSQQSKFWTSFFTEEFVPDVFKKKKTDKKPRSPHLLMMNKLVKYVVHAVLKW